MEARIEQLQADLKAALEEAEQQRKETEAKMELRQAALKVELTPAPPAPAITQEQLTELQARIEGLHVTKLLADEELFALEDMIFDWAEVQASMEDQVITQAALYATLTFGAGVTVHKMIKVSEVATGDAACARQLRRKFM